MVFDTLRILHHLHLSYQQSVPIVSRGEEELLNSNARVPVDLPFRYVQLPFFLFQKGHTVLSTAHLTCIQQQSRKDSSTMLEKSTILLHSYK